MKLNIKNTIFVSLALVIWSIYVQMIDTTVQIVIVKNLGRTEEVKGIVLGVIGFMPLILFPIFAKLSDSAKGKRGRRAPFILIGTVITVVLIVTAGVFADMGSFLGYAVFFTLSYVGISIYRPAATAILPDIIPKPLRSKANAIQGIITSFGSLMVIGLVAIFGDKNILATYIISGALMLLVMTFYLFNINEPKLVKEAEAAMAEYMGQSNEDVEREAGTMSGGALKGNKFIKAMPKVERKSLILLLLSIAMCSFGFGAMISTYQNYAHAVWGMTHSAATVFMLLFGLGGLMATPLVVRLSDRKGRKNTMVAGMIIFIIGTAMIILLQDISATRFIGFTVIGFGWTFMMIMAFPMVLEFSNTLNNGIFASFFTLAFNIPKALTSYISGVMLTRIGYQILFPYTLFFISVGLILILFVKHGNVVEIKRNSEAVSKAPFSKELSPLTNPKFLNIK